MSISKREEVKAQRLRRKRQQRLNTLLIIGGVMLVVIAIIIYPTLTKTLRPVGEVIQITPVVRPLVDGRGIGNPEAPVVIEVFVDFQCSSCKYYAESVEKSLTESEYIANGQVYYQFRHYPFIDKGASIPESHQAANASMCALEQGRFWDYHDMLFANWNGENAGNFTDQRLEAFADSLGLDMEYFNACYDENRYEAEIESDYQRGLGFGVTGTPSVFLNGVAVTPGYVPDYDTLVTSIEMALAGGQ